jgi:dolichyl-phosphate-mannose--protein O-mannosyl transferase
VVQIFIIHVLIFCLSDPGALWVIKEAHNGEACEAGSPVECGRKIRLEHAQTGKNLHSHLFAAPVSGQQEVSAYGENGHGDTGDNWEVVCDSGKKLWMRQEHVQLKHVDTGKFLVTSSQYKFDQRNCGHGCPIMGQSEVACSSSKEPNKVRWVAGQGVYFPAKSNVDNDREL